MAANEVMEVVLAAEERRLERNARDRARYANDAEYRERARARAARQVRRDPKRGEPGYAEFRERANAIARRWYERNKVERNARLREGRRARYAAEPEYRAARNAAARAWRAGRRAREVVG